MGTTYSFVLATPHADYSANLAVEAGLRDLGFVPAEQYRSEVWLRLNEKLPMFTPRTPDNMLEAIRALPWHRWDAPTHLRVLWTADFDTGDDSFGGRVEPYGWHMETLVVGT